jgi:RNA polymerase sigma-70 factor (ECF subfamily)
LAFERLITEYGDRIYSVALRITESAADAEDAMQETLLKAFERRGTFRGEASWTTWLYRIAVNEALMLVRRRQPVEYLDETGYDAAHVVDWSNDLGRRVELNELRAELERGLARLPEDHRVAVILRDVEGLSAAEAAEILDITEVALKSRLHRGRALLRQFLAEYVKRR